VIDLAGCVSSALKSLIFHETVIFGAKLNFSAIVGHLIKVCQVISQETARLIAFAVTAPPPATDKILLQQQHQQYVFQNDSFTHHYIMLLRY
jgi:hypothetical protein